jgi:hypothetical protein
MTVPGASINTVRDMLRSRGTEPYQEYIDQLGENAQAFFSEYQLIKGNDFSSTRSEVLIRLLKALESETFAKMLGASKMKLNIADLVDSGKVVLISTNKNLLKTGSALFGRIFMAGVMQAVMSRPAGHRRRTYLYIDEFADYTEDSHVLLDLFNQGRKYGLGMIVCHQNLEQLTPKLAATMSSSTAIKFAGGTSYEDTRTIAAQMRTTPDQIDRQPKGTFLAYFKGMGTIPWRAPSGRIEAMPQLSNLRDIQARMRELYADDPKPTPRAAEEAADSDDVPSDTAAEAPPPSKPPKKPDDFEQSQQGW